MAVERITDTLYLPGHCSHGRPCGWLDRPHSVYVPLQATTIGRYNNPELAKTTNSETISGAEAKAEDHR